MGKDLREGAVLKSLKQKIFDQKGKLELNFVEKGGLFGIKLEVQEEKGLVIGAPEKCISIYKHNVPGHPCQDFT